MASKLGLMLGYSLDLSVNDIDGKPWDFSDKSKRAKAIKMVRNRQAMLLIGSPMCTAFSRFQQFNYRWKSQDEVDEIMNET